MLRRLLTQKPLRIFLAASRLTEVMQYASKNIGKAFELLGHEVMISVEENDMESLHELITYKPSMNLIHIYF